MALGPFYVAQKLKQTNGPHGTAILMRHGETAWNRQGRVMGRHPVELTDHGRAQVVATAQFALSIKPDLIVTSPPYWNKADYGTSCANLGVVESYTDFLAEMTKAFSECFRVLRPGRKLCVITANVNQHTDHGLLTFPLSADLAMSLRSLGLVMINEIIWSKDGTGGRWGSANGQRPIFGSYPYPPNFLFKNVHEYILIFAKPPEVRTRCAKVKAYDTLMRASTVPALMAAE